MKTLTLVIPVHNEAKRFDNLFNSFKKGSIFQGITVEKVIFVNDGSTDKSLFKIKEFISKQQLDFETEIISYTANKGRGYAVRQGLACSLATDYALYLDADGSISLKNLSKFLPFMEKNYDLLFGSKKAPGAKEIKPRSKLRKLIGWGHSLTGGLFLGVFVWDFQGGFKMFSRNFIETIIPLCVIDRWGFDMEVIFFAKKLKLSSVEIPLTWKPIENGSKVRLIKDIFQSLQDMINIKNRWLKIKTRFIFRSLRSLQTA